MTDTAARVEKPKCPYCGEANFQESEFCWACYKNLRTKIEDSRFESQDSGSKIQDAGIKIPDQGFKTEKESHPIRNLESGILSPSCLASWGRFALVAGLFIFYLQWIRKENYFSFLDFINLAFHEAGHLFLGFFGRFIMMLGGTIFQLIIPAVCAVHLWRQDNRTGWQLCVFWFGESLLNISIYAGDAINQALPLVGGGEHDWTYLLTVTHLIAHTPATAKAIFLTGSAIIFWSLYLIARDGIETLLVLKSNK
ncbi:MAG: hypothetical protein WCK75_00250 [Elusimicrobiota bacterium]